MIKEIATASVLVASGGCFAGASSPDGDGPSVLQDSAPRETTPADRLLGTWAVAGTQCVLGLTFIDEERYSRDVTCPLENGAWGIETERGDFTADGKRLRMEPARASCPAKAETRGGSYKLSGSVLTLADDAGAVELRRVQDDGPANGAVVTFGCWNADDTFTPSKIRDL